MTNAIVDAVRTVLATASRPMDVHEIHKQIVEANLHSLKAKDPIGVIRKVLRRHSDNAATKNASGRKYFHALTDGRFELSRPRVG